MTREQQRKFKELNKVFQQMLKDKIKKYKFKKKDYMIWCCKNDLFYDAFIDIGVTEDVRCVCSVKETIKPLWIDDLLWEMLKMESNKNEPISLRAVGAFTVCGVELYYQSCEIKEFSISELDSCVNKYLEHFQNSVQSASIEDFLNNVGIDPYQRELRNALTFIHYNRYKEALACIDGQKRGGFNNQGIDIFDAIREHCTSKLSQS